MTLKAGAQGILDAIGENKIPDDDVVAAMVACSEVVEREMGGTSGGLYAIGLSGLSKGLVEAAREKDSKVATAEVWARGLEVCAALRGCGLSISPSNSPAYSSRSTPCTATPARGLLLAPSWTRSRPSS